MSRKMVTIDGNEAAAYIAHKINEVIAIYPITPSTSMGELTDAWSATGAKNIWGTVPRVVEMQSEGGASGAVHGSLQTGALTCTFTASQGLLLMIPNMYKIAGELTSTVFHVSARTLATHALSIFGDHSDVMSIRQTGWGMLASNNVQECMDHALIANAATFNTRLPFIHFFDGFRTSSEVQKVEQLTDEDIHDMLDFNKIEEHRRRGLNPDRPVLRGTAQNPDVFFQAREAINPIYEACPEAVQQAMDKFAKLTGRQYRLFDYVGDPEAERVIVMMGSGAEAAHETVEALNAAGEKVGLIKVRLYRPFSGKHMLAALPETVKSIVVLDRSKEPGAQGEPLYHDVIGTLVEAVNEGGLPAGTMPKVIGGRYGLSSKEFTPTMVKSVLDELKTDKPKNHFVVGIVDDVTGNYIEYDENWLLDEEGTISSVFYGLGSDGTVGANKNSIKIIGEETDNWAQGYFVYDSKKSGSTTTSHLRFGKKPIHSTYLIKQADFVAGHQANFVEKFDMTEVVKPGGILLLNSQAGEKGVWATLSEKAQKDIISKKIKLYAIDAYTVAGDTGMGRRINTIMQTCFFAISGVLPKDEAIAQIKKSIEKTYGKRGEKVVQQNFAAVDNTLAALYEVKIPKTSGSTVKLGTVMSDKAPDFVKDVTAEIIAGRGDKLPVSAMPLDGTFPTDTARWEKRSIALEIPVWDTNTCIQCNKCALICPHAAIRPKIYKESLLADAPATFKSDDAKGKEFKGMKYSLQVAAEDCTGCKLCVEYCPAPNKENPELKAINMQEQPPLREQEAENWDFFLRLPEMDRSTVKHNQVKGSQFLRPLFEFSGACPGCGETPYVKLVSQLFGDRMVVANATGCSSIYGGNLPTTPWAVNDEGRGPAWSNSLFEDNAEFGMGFRMSFDKQKEMAEEIVRRHASDIGEELAKAILDAPQRDEAGIFAQRERVARLKEHLLKEGKSEEALRLLDMVDHLVRRSVWIMGGDGWAYDIGFGGLDHVLGSGMDVNILVLDTEVYSNTGGQMSKATPRGAVAKFAAAGRPSRKKDLGMMAMRYGNVYVGQVSMGANDTQTVKTFLEAEAFHGPSIVIAYSPCIAHGIDMSKVSNHMKMAVQSGHWPLYRYNPDLIDEGKNPMNLDSKEPSMPLRDFLMTETRFSQLAKSHPEEAEVHFKLSQKEADAHYRQYKRLADMDFSSEKKSETIEA